MADVTVAVKTLKLSFRTTADAPAEEEERDLVPPLRHPMFQGMDTRGTAWHLTRTWYIFFQQLARRRKAVTGGGGTTQPAVTGPYIRTLVLKNTAVGSDVADHVPAFHAGTGKRAIGVLRKAITANLTVRVNKNASPFISITIPSTTAVDVPVVTSTFAGSAAIADKDVFSWDILASDASTDIAGVATVTLEWS